MSSPERPVPPAGVKGPPRRRSVKQQNTLRPGLLAALLSLLGVLLVIAVFFGWRIVAGQRGALTVLLFASFALLAAAVLTGALRAGGRYKTGTTVLTGASAVFLGIFLALVAANKGQEHQGWTLRGRVLPAGPYEVQISERAGCRTGAERGSGVYALVIHGDCDRDSLELAVQVDGRIVQHQQVSAGAARQGLDLTWQPDLEGTVFLPDGRPAPAAVVALAGCPRADAVPTRPDGGFLLSGVPATCLSPGAQLSVTFDGGTETFPVTEAHRLSLRLRGLPHVRLVRKEGAVFVVELDRAPGEIAPAYDLGSSVWVPDIQPAGKRGKLMTLSQPPQEDALVDLRPLDATHLEARLLMFKDARLPLLRAASLALPGSETLKQQVLGRVLGERRTCGELREQADLLKEVRGRYTLNRQQAQKIADQLVKNRSMQVENHCE